MSGSYDTSAFHLSHLSPGNALTPIVSQWTGTLGVDRHRGKANLLYVDGHTEGQSAEEVFWDNDAESKIRWYGREDGGYRWWD